MTVFRRHIPLLLLMLGMSVSCGTLQVDLAVTPAPPGRPQRHVTPTPNFDRPAYANEAGEILDGGMKLVGYNVDVESGMAGSPLMVTLIWRVLDIIEASYHTNAYVVDEEGRMIAKRDFPTGGAASIWHIPPDGQPARLMGRVMTVPGMQPGPLFAPDLEQIAYLTVPPVPDDPAGSLPAIALSRLGEGGVEEPILYPANAISLHAWSPDSIRLLYRSPSAAVAEITLGQLETRELLSSDDRHRIGRLQWVDKFRFLYIDYGGDGWQIRLAEISGRKPLLIDSADRFPAVFDAAWMPVSSGS